MTAFTVKSCGCRTGPGRARSWSRTSTPYVHLAQAEFAVDATADVSRQETNARPPTSSGGSATEVRFHHSPLFSRILEDSGCSLLLSTYQAGQLVAIGVAEGEL